MSNKPIPIEIIWRELEPGGPGPIPSASTGFVEVPAIILDLVSRKPRFAILQYLDNGIWLDPNTGEEPQDDILAWGNISVYQVLHKMGLNYWRKKAEKALE